MPVLVGISGDGGDDDDDEGTPRSFSFEKRSSCTYPFSDGGLPRLSFSYHKLPPHLLKLSVVKLDASSFDVQIVGNATVGELKESVENVFIQSPKEGEGEISWSHVWGHFCLCYEGQKLISDKDHVRNFGIKDGDQLHFIRHLSINYNVVKRRSKRENAKCKEQPMLSADSSVSENEESGDGYANDDRRDEDSHGDRHDEYSNSDQCDEDSDSDRHDENSKYYDYGKEGDGDLIGHQKFKLAHFLKGWLSYSTLWFVGKTKSQGKTRPSRFSGQFLKLGSKMTLTRL